MTQLVTEAQYLAAIARIYQGKTPIGIAFCVADGYLLTCAHVVSKALGHQRKSYQIPAQEMLGQKIALEFCGEEQVERHHATVAYWRSPAQTEPGTTDVDVAVLKLTESMPIGARLLSLTSFPELKGHTFLTSGTPENVADGAWSEGKIQGATHSRALVQMVAGPGYAIEPGFSGAPVWSPSLGDAIVGMVVARDKQREEERISFMVPAARLQPALAAIGVDISAVQSSSPTAMPASERLQLINTLNSLPTVQFETLVNTLNPPSGLMPPNSAPQGLRSSALLQWVEGPTGPGLSELQAGLQAMGISTTVQDSAQPNTDGTNKTSESSKKERLRKEIQLLQEQLERCFEKRLLTDDPDREVKLEKLEQELERKIAEKQSELDTLD